MKTKRNLIQIGPLCAAKIKFFLRAACHPFGGVVCAVAVMLNAFSAQAQNLFVTCNNGTSIFEYTPGGVQSTFTSGGLVNPDGMAFDSAGNLFVVDWNVGAIYQYTPGGAQSTFASGLSNPSDLAFDSAGNLFEADEASGNIYKFTPGGMRTTFASGLYDPEELAFQPVPEPSTLGLLAVGTIALLVHCRRNLAA
jgi:hypothetical protein